MLTAIRSLGPARSFLPYLVRRFSEENKENKENHEKSFFSRFHLPKRKAKEVSIFDSLDAIRFVNYRYDFPQGLTSEEKSQLKRFDIFRYLFSVVNNPQVRSHEF